MRCDPHRAIPLIRAWHSRLPRVQNGPWQFAFVAEREDAIYAAALWNNPSARCLPSHWLELRRLACSPDAPRNTASRFLAWMVRWFAVNAPERERCISYQDTSVHTGAIYRACGWTATHTSSPRIRNRNKPRRGTNRLYRTNLNGIEADACAKTRWEQVLK
jgi:hypothetical protein